MSEYGIPGQVQVSRGGKECKRVSSLSFSSSSSSSSSSSIHVGIELQRTLRGFGLV